MNYFTVQKVLYKYHKHKGTEAERRSLEQIKTHYRELPWIKYARKATKKEDQEGIDIVVHTKNFGELFVQIKSSFKNAEKFYRKHPDKTVAMIIVREEYSDNVVWREVKGGLIRLRREILKNKYL